MEDLRARDLMVSLDDYAVVSEEATILEAVLTLESAQKKLPADRHMHRAVLVADRNGRIVGKVGHFAFLKGLEPQYGQMGDWEAVSRAGLSSSFVRSVLDSQQLWHQEFDELRKRVRTTRIREIMRPVGVSVGAEAPLTDAIHFFVIYQTLSLLVQDGEEVVGILRLSDVYRHVYDSLRDNSSGVR